ncbi:Diphthine synthase [Carpediemonas membranifera]|uniref:diphthine methyl ester synthase n=1 Tax=Carpediemonas membranifera TaxID=201153 RepID=A0A8J6E7W4_9EUKA|nr:Diphthine synthase [Carpediemonas membranifera]|eukprot:KAG9391150.1 Diphthine synthase [Carpediemonas membranifera]
MLFLIGLGLGGAEDITVRGMRAIETCTKVYLESYTSILKSYEEMQTLIEQFHGKELIEADRDLVEQGSDQILDDAATTNVALLVVGDPFCATTHADFFLRAKERGIGVSVIHNASIMNAVACTGLELYRFGQTISVPFFTDSWRPDSFYEKLGVNKANKLHTLCLLDIKTKERSYRLEDIMAGRTDVFLKPRYMTAPVAAQQLLEIEEEKGEGWATPDTMAVAVCRVGTETQKLAFGTLKQISELDEDVLGGPLHSLVVTGEVHEMELKMLELNKI